MLDAEQREGARQFINQKWQGYEKGETHRFWLSLLSKVLGVENATEFIEFEKQVLVNGNTKFIDGYIPSTKVLIEQKSSKFDLNKPEPQSGGDMLTPYEQAFRYNSHLNLEDKAKWIVTCNFTEFHIYNMNDLNSEPQIIRLENLQDEYKYLDFLIRNDVKEVTKEKDLSVQAGNIVGEIYDALLKQYKDPTSEETLKSLNALCVRLVFCMYAEDAGIFGKHDLFSNYLIDIPAQKWHRELKDIFTMLDTPYDKRDGYDPELEEFPYVNGGLFTEDKLEIPSFTDEIVYIIINKGCKGFNWRDISPTIFGAVFESTLNQETRRSGGMHYTSIENIHKVIDPLFLNDLKQELQECKNAPKASGSRTKKLQAFQNKLASLTFFDPACGSGNFLTETYLSIRRLENEVLKHLGVLNEGQVTLDFVGNEYFGVQVSIQQFYGIEINDFAVSVAKTALWIAEAQMLAETKSTTKISNDFLPLTTNANIHEGNSLKIDWGNVISSKDLNYIIGNPPFVGMKEQTPQQKEDMRTAIPVKKIKQMDYVASWYFKACDYMKGTKISCAFVSSNSITQGEQALTIWEPLIKEYGITINFAYRTFEWDSQASGKAHVHCVIIGFSYLSSPTKKLYDGNTVKECENINQYLVPGESIFIKKTGKPLFTNEPMTKGAQLIDGGNFIIGGESEYLQLIKQEPNIKQYIRKYYNAKNLLNNGDTTYVLYLENASPSDIKNSPFVSNRVNKVYEYRANNESPSTNILKDTPTHYFQPQAPESTSVVIPVVSSEQRKYIPICFMPKGMVYTNALFYIDNASLYTFGILTSNVHMAWTKLLCGRLKSDFRYSNTMVYNTFPFPTPTQEQKQLIESTAQHILDIRDKYKNESLANLYDKKLMPTDLRKVHQDNDRAVMKSYGFNVKTMSESDCVAELMKMYENNINQCFRKD